MNQNKRILICESRNLSYGSSGFFLRKIREALEESGNEITYFHLAEDQANMDELENFVGSSFDAVLDINSYLPLIVREDGSYLLDCIDAPFFNYIVDHPLHLHPILNSPVANHRIICLDLEHQSYIEKYYPNIQACYVLPVAASRASIDRRFSERSWQLYFPGTYTPLSEYENKLKERNPVLLSLAENYILSVKEGTVIGIPEWVLSEKAYAAIAENTGMEASACAERLHLDCRYIERYVREVYRHRMIEKLLAEGFSVHVTGAYWEYYEGRKKKNLHIHPACTYSEMLEHMADSQVIINVQPLFVHAPHDRILCGMANGAAVFTDSCTWLRKHLKAGKDYISYDVNAMNAGVKMLRKMLTNPTALQEMSQAGQAYVMRHFLWPDWCGQFLEMIDKEKGKR